MYSERFQLPPTISETDAGFDLPMPFENAAEQYKPREAQQAPRSITLLPSASEYQTFGTNALVQRSQASSNLVGSGVLTNLQFNFDSQNKSVLIAQGAAEQTGRVIDYPSNRVGDQTYKSGMDWEQSQSLDTRQPSEKLQDFLGALSKNATNPEIHKQYIQGELDKIIGTGEGLNIAKEATKGTAAAGLKALTDGTVADFLSKPNALHDPLFKIVGTALDAMSKDPNTANKALEALGTALKKSSEDYSKLPNLEKGHVIGQAMFGFVNPEGSTEAAKTSLKIASNVATHVDAAVMATVHQSVKAIDELAKTAPELVQQSKQMFFDYLKSKGLSGPELEYAGIPKGYFDGVAGKDNNFNAMTKPSDLGGDSGLSKNPTPGSLTNIEARDWYNAKIIEIDNIEQQMRSQGKSAEEIFDTTTQLRNEAKQQTRDAMKDRAEAKRLERFYPLPTRNEVLAKYGGDYEKAIAASKRTNPDINRQIEQLRKQGEQNP